MLSITPEYRKAIQLHRTQGVRNASYARIYIGQFDASAAGDASISLLDNGATRAVDPYVGFTSNQLSGAGGVLSPAMVLTVSFGGIHSMSGITLQFGTVYASEFTVATYLDSVLVETHSIVNTATRYEGVLTLDDHDTMVITFTKLSAAASAFTLQQLLFGIGLTYDNEDILRLSIKQSNSPLSTELPTSSASFTLYNEDGIFDPDGDNSVLSFFSTDQKCAVTLGYDISGTGDVEWIPHSTRYMSEWSAAGIEATFRTESILTRMTKTTYRRGKYGPLTIRALIDDVMLDYPDVPYDASQYRFGIQTVTEPLPIASHAECLQIIANIAIATIEELPDGTLILRERADAVPTYTIPKIVSVYPPASPTDFPNSTAYLILGSAAVDLVSTDPIVEYAAWEADGFALSGNMKFVPDDNASYVTNGLVWDTFPVGGALAAAPEVQDAYAPMPAIRFDFVDDVSFGSVKIDFGENFVPTYIEVRGYRSDDPYAPVYKKIWRMDSKQMTIVDNFDRVVWIYLSVLGSDKQQRARIQRVAFSWENGYTLTADDIFDKAIGTRLPKCRNLIIPFVNRIAQTSAFFKEVTVTAGVETWIEYGGAYKNVSAATTTAGATLSSTFYGFAMKVTATGVSGDVVVRLTGQEMKDGALKSQTVAINTQGEDVTITNPLLTAASLPSGYVAWMTEHMTRDIEWSANVIGYPEIQPADVIGYKADDVPAIVMETELTFNGGLREKIVLLKQGVM